MQLGKLQRIPFQSFRHKRTETPDYYWDEDELFEYILIEASEIKASEIAEALKDELIGESRPAAFKVFIHKTDKPTAFYEMSGYFKLDKCSFKYLMTLYAKAIFDRVFIFSSDYTPSEYEATRFGEFVVFEDYRFVLDTNDFELREITQSENGDIIIYNVASLRWCIKCHHVIAELGRPLDELEDMHKYKCLFCEYVTNDL